MFKKLLKWIGYLLVVALAVVVLALLALYMMTETRINKVYDVPVEAIEIPSDPASIERGRHLVAAVVLCMDCHSPGFSGQVWDDGWLLARLSPSNLTSGNGGIGRMYTDEDWVRAIRHGIGKDGKSLLVMPSNSFYYLSDEDLGAIITFVKSTPPIDNELPKLRLGPMGRLFLLQTPGLLPAEVIDHFGPRPVAPEPGITAEYGAYIAFSCRECHGQDLAGGPEPGEGLNLTPGDELATWTEADFITAIRTGDTPDGKQLDNELMPWKTFGAMTDEELKAIWLYVQSVPAVESPLPTPGS